MCARRDDERPAFGVEVREGAGLVVGLRPDVLDCDGDSLPGVVIDVEGKGQVTLDARYGAGVVRLIPALKPAS